ncbi:MAG: hypothetical protein R2695_10010 [Acidimicrobiales bacterium]
MIGLSAQFFHATNATSAVPVTIATRRESDPRDLHAGDSISCQA